MNPQRALKTIAATNDAWAIFNERFREAISPAIRPRKACLVPGPTDEEWFLLNKLARLQFAGKWNPNQIEALADLLLSVMELLQNKQAA